MAAILTFLFLFLIPSILSLSLNANGYVRLNLPSLTSSHSDDRPSLALDSAASLLDSRDSKPFALRIMPLGASITYGYKSPDGNGYRKYLRDNLTAEGWEVNMVGSMQAGTMENNQNEGHIGFRVDQIAVKAQLTIPKKPNLILINAGTNDALQNYNISTAGERMNKLLDTLYDSIPGTTVILSTLLPNKRYPTRVANISVQYREIVAQRQNSSQRIVLADMAEGTDSLSSSELVDNTHPNEQGYSQMAAIWLTAIQEADSKGFFTTPATVAGVNDAEYGNGTTGGTTGHSTTDDKLTEAGKIIIGVVVPLGVITIGVLAFFLYRQWQRRRNEKTEANSVTS